MPLAGFGRGSFLPYFVKQGEIMPPFPQEQKRGNYRGFPVLTGMLKMGKEPNLGVFSIRIHTPFF